MALSELSLSGGNGACSLRCGRPRGNLLCDQSIPSKEASLVVMSRGTTSPIPAFTQACGLVQAT
jgi:hypothetical protein